MGTTFFDPHLGQTGAGSRAEGGFRLPRFFDGFVFAIVLAMTTPAGLSAGKAVSDLRPR